MLVCDSAHRRVAVFTSAGNMLWERSFPNPYDAHILSDNTVLVATGKGVQQISIEKKVLMNYAVKGEMLSVAPLEDSTMLALNTTEGVAVKLNRAGKVLQTIPLKGNKGHLGSRMVRSSGKNSFLVGHGSENMAREYNFQGNVLAEYKAPSFVYEARRLANGSTLISHEQGIMEFCSQGNVLRSVTRESFSDRGIKWFTGLRELPNGNWLATNWLGHGQEGKGVPFIEIDQNNKVVWSFDDNKQVLAATNVAPLSTEQLAAFMLPAEYSALMKRGVLAKTLLAQATCPTFPKGTLEKFKDYPDEPENLAEKISKNSEYLKELKAMVDGLEQELTKTALPSLKMLFVERKQYPPDHHNTGTEFPKGEINQDSFKRMIGASLKTLDILTGEIKTLYHCEKGVVRDPEVSFDGTKILFSARQNFDDDYHIYEMNHDGSNVRQLTSAPGVTDIDPFYLADGDIGFGSTREPKYCGCNRHIMVNLYRMRPDGANIEQIGKSIEYEGHGVQLPDGRLMYYRWEYVDRNFGGAQALWVGNPDGTAHALYYGQETPHSMLNPRAIPGTQNVICILSSCHDRPWGAVAILDRRKGTEGKEPILQTWPKHARDMIVDAKRNYGGSGGFDEFTRLELKYEDPLAVNEHCFLVSRQVVSGNEKTGIYVLDTSGRESLLYESQSRDLGVYDPMLIRPTQRPKIIPQRRNHTDAQATCIISNVNFGTHMKNVEPGSIKYIRVVEPAPKLTWVFPTYGGQGTQSPAINNHDFDVKVIHGTVPVEDDGSAFFQVPANKFIFLQSLDKDKKLVQSMRSGMALQSGEMVSCMGCHENRNEAPTMQSPAKLKALGRAPSQLQGWFGAVRNFGYMKEVQPVFDAKCVSCHDYGKKAGDNVNLASDRDIIFNASYQELHQKGYTGTIGGGPNAIPEAKSWGSHQSKLVKRLETSSCGNNLTSEEFERIITWIDLNATYYPTHSSAYPNNAGGRSPLNNQQLNRLTELNLLKKDGYNRFNSAHLISFDRPELSPILNTDFLDVENRQIIVIKSGTPLDF